MIFVRDRGRMANNILQYGHLYAWAKEHGRKTVSMRFAYKYSYFHISNTSLLSPLTFYLLPKIGAKLGLIPVVAFHDEGDAQGNARKEQALLRHRLVIAEGWYARWYDLFLKYKSEIVSLFAFKPSVSASADAFLTALPPADLLLGVHIRRGDYRTWHDGRFFYSDQQYLSLIRQFLLLHHGKQVNVIVCGNDPAVSADSFRGLHNAHVVCPKGNPGEDLCLLSRCNFLIGPPSTFTLVAAMYRDLPLYWVKDADKPLTEECFGHFDNLFRQIL